MITTAVTPSHPSHFRISPRTSAVSSCFVKRTLDINVGQDSRLSRQIQTKSRTSHEPRLSQGKPRFQPFACSKNENGPIFVQYSLVSAAGQAPSHLEACDAQ
jgi:hypothetical protein